MIWPIIEGMRRAVEIVGPRPIERDARGLALRQQAGVPAAAVGRGRVVHLRAVVGERHFGSRRDRDARRRERVVLELDLVGVARPAR